MLNNLKSKINKRNVFYCTTLFSILLIGMFPVVFKADFGDILSGGIAKLIIVIGKQLENLLQFSGSVGDKSLNMSMSQLVFNADKFDSASNIKDLNLTLLKKTTLNSGVITVYNLMWFISVCTLTFTGLWFTIDFVKTADNPEHKKVLKSKITRLMIAILILANINLMVETLLVINQVFLDCFKLLIKQIAPDMKFDGPFMMETFRTLADPKGLGNESIPLAIAYLGCGILNLWLIVYYIIRDLTISFLYIFAPFMIILIPLKLDIFLKWLKEMVSNIFTQAVHGLILVIIIACATAVSGSTATFYDQIFVLVAFAMFIPMTGMIKKLIGLEGEFGAAKSTAGIAGVMGAMALGGAVVGMAKKGGAAIDAGRDYKNAGADLDSHVKGVGGGNSANGSSSIGGGGMNPSSNAKPEIGQNTNTMQTNISGGSKARTVDGIDRSLNTPGTKDLKSEMGQNYNATSVGNQLKGQKKLARKRLISSTVGAGLGVVAGANMGVGMAMLNPMAGALGAKMGSDAGDEVGKVAGKGVHNVANVAEDVSADLYNGKGIRFDGIQRDANSLTEGIDLGQGMEKVNSFADARNNFSQLKTNAKKGFETGKANLTSRRKGSEYTRDNASAIRDEMFGIDQSTLSKGNYKTEVKANISRQKHEQRGNFDKAHVQYANKTYNRNTNYRDMADDMYSNKKVNPRNEATSKSGIYENMHDDILKTEQRVAMREQSNKGTKDMDNKENMYEQMFYDMEQLGDTELNIGEMKNYLEGKNADLFALYNSSQLS